MKNKLIKEIALSMKDNPEQWSINDYYCENISWGVKLRTSGGKKKMILKEPTEIPFSFSERRVLWRSYEKLRKVIILNKKPL